MNHDLRYWVLAAAALAGCLAPPVESPPTTASGDIPALVQENVQNKVDILFMIDDSDSMQPKQDHLKERLPLLIQTLDSFAADGKPAWYHIGVVTSDLGSAGSKACATVGGDGGRLNDQNRSDPKNSVGCGLGNGLHYIDYDQNTKSSNIPAGSTLAATFQCLASVGVRGCGFEHQLESVYRALHDCPDDAHCAIAQNRGFLRPDATLAVVWVTDEDDCSAPPDSDLFDTNKNGTDYSLAGNYGPLTSFRCTHFGLTCGDNHALLPAADSMDQALSCSPAGSPPGQLFDVQRYIDFFTNPDGVKKDPNNVILVSIAAPPTPVRVLLSNPAPTVPGPYARCSSYNGVNCSYVLDHSCAAASDSSFVGDPAVRLDAVVQAAANHDDGTSICADSYTQAIDQLSALIKNKISAGCLSAPIAHPDTPDCTAYEDVTNSDGTVTRSIIRQCDGSGVLPCWRVVAKPECPPLINPETGLPQQLGVTIDRAAGAASAVSYIWCETITYKSDGEPSPSPH